ncbi:DMT family transporter [Aquabacterium sp.]|uniref:DMT family transporter n=1 Tax=Aquabacterium sp. TaxID=1872578 RepID=UPI0037845F3A
MSSSTVIPLRSGLSDSTRGWLLGALGVLAFAFTIPMTRLAGGDAAAPQLSPVFVAVGRAAVAGLLALAWLLAVRAPRPRPGQWRVLALAVVGVVFGFPLCIGLAVRHVDAAHAAVVTGVLPIATAAMGAWWLRQRASLGFWLCAALGTALVLGFAAWKSGSGLQPADALLMAAVLFGGFGYVQCARLFTGPQAMPPAQVISWVLVLALPLTLPVSAWLLLAAWPAHAVHAPAWLGFAYVSLISMWLGFFPWYRGLALGGTLRVSQVQLLQPFLSMWLAVPLLGESLDGPTVAFSLAVMATVFVSRRQSAAPR